MPLLYPLLRPQSITFLILFFLTNSLSIRMEREKKHSKKQKIQTDLLITNLYVVQGEKKEENL